MRVDNKNLDAVVEFLCIAYSTGEMDDSLVNSILLIILCLHV